MKKSAFVVAIVVMLMSAVAGVVVAAPAHPQVASGNGAGLAAVIVAVLLGITARTVIPFLQTLRDNPETQFDRKFVIPAVMTLLIALITSPLVFAALPQDQFSNPDPTFGSLILLFTAAWGATDVIREAQKFLGGKSASA